MCVYELHQFTEKKNKETNKHKEGLLSIKYIGWRLNDRASILGRSKFFYYLVPIYSRVQQAAYKIGNGTLSLEVERS